MSYLARFQVIRDDKTFILKVGLDEWPDNDLDFGNEKENAEYLARFESGELLCVYLEVSVYDKSGNVQGSDHLGMVHLKANEFQYEATSIADEYGMYNGALNDLKRILNEIITANSDLIEFNITELSDEK